MFLWLKINRNKFPTTIEESPESKLERISIEMVRGKTEMKRIENECNRKVTFSKRRNGLLKKAHELSVLCDAQVGVIIFSQKGTLFEFSSTSSHISKILERYQEYTGVFPPNKLREDYIQKLKFDSASMEEKIEILELSRRKMLGHCLSSCSFDELQQMEDKLHTSLQCIRLRKTQLFKEQIEQLQSKCMEKPLKHIEEEATETTHHTLDVETDLFIGLPKQYADHNQIYT
ncbi:truncated transcription factor CAULIFLOWER A isoform X3 [Arachis duranensis]|uniref:Truncated transcription factor CAULIFLOWER A isoform X3 n=1 Tax=Arachis duranensis TaxID=130453 RepID=A0A9C6TG30_ARADU|nr:truncated transcription factor CAULIFLOWER A isoform X3 [Arachis duranensis]